MNYTLMHKNIAAAEIEIDEDTGVIARIGTLYSAEHLPVGVGINDSAVQRRDLNDWWVGRSIPASRQGIREALETLRLSSTQLLLDKCMGLSLSDHYWIRPVNSGLNWNEVNFFENPFSPDMSDVLFGAKADGRAISLLSPDSTSDGWLKKKWIISGGKRYLVKGGSGITRAEPLNEAVASEIMRRLDIAHVPYTLTQEKNEPYSVCENFITPRTELVSAWQILRTQKKLNHDSKYRHFMNCCAQLGIPGAETAVSQMLAVDYLIVNEDRHFNNFGAVRDPETLEWLGLAPIFDSGTSLWYNTPTPQIGGSPIPKSKPFRARHADQIKLAEDLDSIALSKLSDIEDAASEIFASSALIDSERRERLCGSLAARVRQLSRIRDNRDIRSDRAKKPEEKT